MHDIKCIDFSCCNIFHISKYKNIKHAILDDDVKYDPHIAGIQPCARKEGRSPCECTFVYGNMCICACVYMYMSKRVKKSMKHTRASVHAGIVALLSATPAPFAPSCNATFCVCIYV